MTNSNRSIIDACEHPELNLDDLKKNIKQFVAYGLPLCITLCNPTFGLSMALGAFLQRQYFYLSPESRINAKARKYMTSNNIPKDSIDGHILNGLRWVSAKASRVMTDVKVDNDYNQGMYYLLLALAFGFATSLVLPISYFSIACGLTTGLAVSRVSEELIAYL